MRKKHVLGNWKMNFTVAEAEAVLNEFLSEKAPVDAVQVGFAPGFLGVGSVVGGLRGTSVWAGAQDCFWADKGAFTGCVSVPMLVDAGVDFCIVGHSERRGRFGKLETPESTIPYFAESDETVNLKTKVLLAKGIRPVVCVGETLTEREDGHTDSTIIRQIQGGLTGIDKADAQKLLIAYEPVWAIGTGKVCDAEEANRICALIRSALASIFDAETASGIPVLYGGSVKASNAVELFAKSDIDGGLVGGASMVASELAEIIRAASRV